MVTTHEIGIRALQIAEELAGADQFITYQFVNTFIISNQQLHQYVQLIGILSDEQSDS